MPLLQMFESFTENEGLPYAGYIANCNRRSAKGLSGDRDRESLNELHPDGHWKFESSQLKHSKSTGIAWPSKAMGLLVRHNPVSRRSS